MWLATKVRLYSLDPANGQIRQYSHHPNDPSSLSSNEVKSSGEDKGGRFWVANGEGLDEFDHKMGRVTLHVPLHEPSREMSFSKIRFGVFWIFHASTGNGLAVFDRTTNTLTHYSFRKQENGQHRFDRRDGYAARRSKRHFMVCNAGAVCFKFERNRRRFIAYRNDPADPESVTRTG